MKNNKELILSWYGSHNATAAMYYDGKYTICEIERWLNAKNQGLCNYMPSYNIQNVYDEVTNWLLSQTDRSDVDVYIEGYMNRLYVKPKFDYHKTFGVDHHMSHAAGAFYQSPYKEALIFTVDGGADAKYFTVNLGSRLTGVKMIDSFDYDLGFAYMILAHYIDVIKKESLTIGNLVYAGKLMGLCSYGKHRPEWDEAFDKFYDSFIYGGNGYIGGTETAHSAITTLMNSIGVEDFQYDITRFKGEFAEDLATNTQLAFERKFYKHAQKYLDMYPDMPICVSGGCALNVLLNAKLAKERNGKIFVPPNPNDCGIAVGQILAYQKPDTQADLTYSGTPILDKHNLAMYLEDRSFSVIQDVSLSDLAVYLAKGNIVGFIQGNSEHGARALGNRSILCNPGVKDMKDILNHKVKNREPYRPFAPLVKLENTSKYFEFYGEDSRHMTFVANVKDEWKEKLAAITHQDGTGRIQTVTRWQNTAIYDLLTEFEPHAGHGVLLNTSFNVNGKPILTRYSDALDLLKNTKLDAVYIHERKLIIFKNGEERKFNRTLEQEGLSEITLDTTVNVWAFPENPSELVDKFIPTIQKLAKKVDKLVVITPQEYVMQLHGLFSSQPNVKIYSIGTNKHYYNQQIHNNLRDHEFAQGLDLNSAFFFSKYIKPLWTKEVVTDNVFSTKYHLFIDLSFDDNYNYNVVRDIKTLMDFAKDETDVINITAVKDYTSEFATVLCAKKENTSGLVPIPFIYYGNIEAIINRYSNHYEAMLLHYLNLKQVGTMVDYCLASYLESYSGYHKFIELEKVSEEL